MSKIKWLQSLFRIKTNGSLKFNLNQQMYDKRLYSCIKAQRILKAKFTNASNAQNLSFTIQLLIPVEIKT